MVVKSWAYIDYSECPEHLREDFRNYLERGVEPGGFLTKVLESDLIGACLAADGTSKLLLYACAKFLWQQFPLISYGSKDKVNDWIIGGWYLFEGRSK